MKTLLINLLSAADAYFDFTTAFPYDYGTTAIDWTNWGVTGAQVQPVQDEDCFKYSNSYL